jgi:hypothetical protein
MIYIPDEWLKNVDNREKVHEILDTGFVTDLNLSVRIPGMLARLKAIGEPGIAKKLETGEIVLST